MPAPEAVIRYYETNYSQDRTHAKQREYDKTMRRRAVAQSDFMEQFVKLSGKTALDYGCGYAWLVQEMQKRGAAAAGYEYDDRCIEAAAARGLEVRKMRSEAEVADFPEVHVITASHVVEHLMHPEETLKHIREKSDYFFLEVPHYDRDLKDQWRNLLGHTQFFNPESLRLLCERTGFEVLHLDRYGPSMNFQWTERWQYWQRKIKQVFFWHTFDYFFGQYSRPNPQGIWIRALLKPHS